MDNAVVNPKVVSLNATTLQEVGFDSEARESVVAEVFREVSRESRIETAAGVISKQIEKANTPMHVGVAQIKALPTRFAENIEGIRGALEIAESRKLDLFVFPELCISGYLALDHFTDPRFIDANLEALKKVAELSEGKNVVIVIGFADRVRTEEGDKIYNAAAVIHNGKIVDIVHKSLLPEYDIFWEDRYFRPSTERHVVHVNGFKLGIGICEDLWDKDYSTKVYDELAAQGATYFVNLSASPFQPCKVQLRYELIQRVVERHHKPFIYANLVGAQDGYQGEVIFDGRSMVVSANGSLAGLGKSFDQDLLIVDHYQEPELLLPSWSPVEETFEALKLGIKDYLMRFGFERAYINMSGGVDSALVGALAKEALGAENVIAVTQPSKITSSETLNDAQLICRNLNIPCLVWPIADQMRAWQEEAAKISQITGIPASGLSYENAQPRIRSKNIFGLTNDHRHSIVLGTGNKTELALGYCTLYGDMSAGLNVIGDVNKELVYDLVRYYNRLNGWEIIPESIIDRPPTAELSEGQTDEKGLGAPYSILSPLVEAIIEDRTSREELITKYPEPLVDKVIKLIQRNEFKRRQAAPAIRVTSKAFGSGRRYPVDSKFY